MNANLTLNGSRESAVAEKMATRTVSNLVIDNLDEFAAGIFTCATSADYAIGSL